MLSRSVWIENEKCVTIIKPSDLNMVLYFVCKLKLVSNKPTKKNLKKNKVSLLGFSGDDEEAWKMVKGQAHTYKTKKNDKLCDQTDKSEGSIVKEIYKIKNPKETEDKVHTIEVIKQWREKGWLSTEYKELKIAEFSMIRFEGSMECVYCQSGVDVQAKPDLQAIAHVVGTGTGNPHPQLMKDLRNSDLFRERIKQVEKYSRYTGIDEELTDSVETE